MTQVYSTIKENVDWYSNALIIFSIFGVLSIYVGSIITQVFPSQRLVTQIIFFGMGLAFSSIALISALRFHQISPKKGLKSILGIVICASLLGLNLIFVFILPDLIGNLMMQLYQLTRVR